MFSKLFHKDVFIPNGTKEVCKNLQKTLTKYYFSKHFSDHLNEEIKDRSHKYLRDIVIECLDSLKDVQRDIFEVELSKDFHYFKKSGWFVTKYCCRIPYSSTQDLVVAIRPQYKDGVVVDNMIVTAWLNQNTDHHYTLDETKYCSKEDWNSLY